MGILNRNMSQEEIVYNRIISNIKSYKMNNGLKKMLLEDINDIKNNKIRNYFYELDFLERAIDGFLTTYQNVLEHIDIDEYYYEFKKFVGEILPAGVETKNYEDIKELILKDYIRLNSLATQDIEENNLFMFIKDKRVYLLIMNSMNKHSMLRDRYHYICKFVSRIYPYVDDETLINYLFAFIKEVLELDDIEGYIDSKVEECKLRVGIPMIDEKSIALISSEVRKAKNLMRTIEVMERNITVYKNQVEAITRNGEKRLKELSDESEARVIKIVDDRVRSIITELDQYLIKLEANMRDNADRQFNQVMESAAEKIKEIRMSALEITNVTTSEMIRLRGVSDEIVKQAKTYIEDDPKVRELVKEASKDAMVKDAIINMNKNDSKVVEKVEVVNTGSRIITSSPAIIINDTDIVKEILPIYNQDIPFEERYNIYLQEKENRMKGGRHSRKELFHEKADEAARCIIENDWLYGWGPSGSGKSKTIYQLGEIFKTDVLPNGRVTDIYSVMAYNDPHGNFRPTPAYLAVKEGKILLLDEFDNGVPDTQVAFNDLYSASLDVLENPKRPRYVYFGENIMVRVHPNFRLVALGNTKGEGEDELHNARAQIDEAVRQRMTPKYFDYDNRLEENIFNQENIAWLAFIRKFRGACLAWAKKEDHTFAPGNVTTRDASAISRYAKNNSKTLEEVLAEKFIQTKDNQYLGFLMKNIADSYKLREVTKFNYPKNISKVSENEIAKAFVLEIKKRVNL